MCEHLPHIAAAWCVGCWFKVFYHKYQIQHSFSVELPNRHTLNRAFLALAAGAGATCAITDSIRRRAMLPPRDRRIEHETGRKGELGCFGCVQ